MKLLESQICYKGITNYLREINYGGLIMDILIWMISIVSLSGLITTQMLTAHLLMRSRSLILPLSIPNLWERKRKTILAWRRFFWVMIALAFVLWCIYEIFVKR